MVIWIIGLSGAGKTTIGRHLYAELRRNNSGIVFVDGDELRDVFKFDNHTNSHTIEGRRINGERILAVCRWLDNQNIDIVCSVLSIFPDLRQIARETLSCYKEVYLNVPIDVLTKRDHKKLYSRALSGKLKDVVGIDIPFPEPTNSDLEIKNYDVGIDEVVGRILEDLNLPQ
jgi:cytidine diphosphoramidate kinase